ncbi:hypothetical protein H0E87_009286, partial [Populus deltoides]
QDAYVCDNANSFGWTGLPSHIYMASVDAQKKIQSFASGYLSLHIDKMRIPSL